MCLLEVDMDFVVDGNGLCNEKLEWDIVDMDCQA